MNEKEFRILEKKYHKEQSKRFFIKNLQANIKVLKNTHFNKNIISRNTVTINNHIFSVNHKTFYDIRKILINQYITILKKEK